MTERNAYGFPICDDMDVGEAEEAQLEQEAEDNLYVQQEIESMGEIDEYSNMYNFS